jgi:hypothetical protein
MIGRKAPETCWASHKRQVINLRNCCILLVDLFESLAKWYVGVGTEFVLLSWRSNGGFFSSRQSIIKTSQLHNLLFRTHVNFIFPAYPTVFLVLPNFTCMYCFFPCILILCKNHSPVFLSLNSHTSIINFSTKVYTIFLSILFHSSVPNSSNSLQYFFSCTLSG